MIKILKIPAFILLACLAITACQPDEVGDVNTSLDNHTPYFNHQWNLSAFEQVDQTAQPGQLAKLDLSSVVINGQENNITFSNNSFLASGIITDAIGSSGTWTLDNPTFPTQLVMDSDLGVRMLNLRNSVLAFSESLVLQIDKTSCIDGSPTVSYIYTYTKQ